MFDRLDSRTAIFCSWTKAERRRRFAPLVASFDRMYESIYAFRAGRGEHGLLSPDELAQWANSGVVGCPLVASTSRPSPASRSKTSTQVGLCAFLHASLQTIGDRKRTRMNSRQY